MTLKELLNAMDQLMNESKTCSISDIIKKSVQLGMNYQEDKIKSGMKIVFDSLHKKN